MQFYVVSDDYITHLKTVDKHVPNNYGETRPYIGVVMEINNIKYLAPLTSHKEKHNEIKAGIPTVFKMHELGNEDNKLGMVQINNMLPILDSEVELLNMEAQSKPYQRLLNLQQQFLRKNKDRFIKKARKLYMLVTEKKVPGLVKNCCDFKALEKAMKTFTSEIEKDVSQEKLNALVGMFKN